MERFLLLFNKYLVLRILIILFIFYIISNSSHEQFQKEGVIRKREILESVEKIYIIDSNLILKDKLEFNQMKMITTGTAHLESFQSMASIIEWYTEQLYKDGWSKVKVPHNKPNTFYYQKGNYDLSISFSSEGKEKIYYQIQIYNSQRVPKYYNENI